MRELPDDDRPKFERLAAVIQEDIQQGKLKPGERLPPVRDLRTTFSVSEGTALNALRLLRNRGSVRRDSTRGHFVREAGQPVTAPDAGDSPSPEYSAIMREIRGLRGELESLAQRLGQLEELVTPERRT